MLKLQEWRLDFLTCEYLFAFFKKFRFNQQIFY